MTEKEKKFLSDIQYSVRLIELFIAGISSFDQYTNDFKTKSAVERHLGIIGEAINKFLKESPDNKLKGSSQIVGLRNRLVHSYDSVDDAIIWSIITRHLDQLKEEVTSQLSQ